MTGGIAPTTFVAPTQQVIAPWQPITIGFDVPSVLLASSRTGPGNATGNPTLTRLGDTSKELASVNFDSVSGFVHELERRQGEGWNLLRDRHEDHLRSGDVVHLRRLW